MIVVSAGHMGDTRCSCTVWRSMNECAAWDERSWWSV